MPITTRPASVPLTPEQEAYLDQQAAYAQPLPTPIAPTMSAPRTPVPMAPTPQSSGGTSFRPTLQGPSGWAGPDNVGVHGGAWLGGGRVNTSRMDFPSGHPTMSRAFNEKGHPLSGGRGPSPQYQKARAMGDALRGKAQGMASGLRSGAPSGGGSYGATRSSGGGGGGYGSFGGSSYGGSTSNAYARQQKQAERQAHDQARLDALYRQQALAMSGYGNAIARGQMIGSRILAKPWDPRVVDAEYATSQADSSRDAYQFSNQAYNILDRYTKQADRFGRKYF